MDIQTAWNNNFPYLVSQRELSFLPLLATWKEKAHDKDELNAFFFQKLLEEVKSYPILLQEKVDKEELVKDKEALAFIVNSVFPVSLDSKKQMYMMSLPFAMDIVYASQGFKDNFLCPDAFSPSNIEEKKEEMRYSKLIHAYKIILNQFYDLNIKTDSSLVYKVMDKTGLNRYFYSEANADFIEVRTSKRLPPKEEILKLCSGTSPCIRDLENWQKVLPLEDFVFSGFLILQLKDFTNTESVSELSNALLEENDFSSKKFMEVVDQSVKSLLGVPNIKVGIAAFQKFDNKYLISDRRLANSFLIRHLCMMDCDHSYESVVSFLSNVKDPVFLNDFATCAEAPDSYTQIQQMGIKEIIIVPLHYDGRLVGVLEICAEEEGVLNALMLDKLKSVNQPLAVAMQKNMKQFEYKVQQVIRKNYTAIQPAIEWKFNEVAVQKIVDQENGKNSSLQPVVFDNVYPLYAAVDIRNSSATRLETIQRDLQQQLRMAQKIIHGALVLNDLPVLEKMSFKIQKMLDDIQLILVADDESKINYFLLDELEPLFKHLQIVHPSLNEEISTYFSRVNGELGLLYENRSAFEQSLSLLNSALSQHIDKAQVQAQEMFPHYYEKYKTDGIDYNIYIGQSLVRDKIFDPVYLKSLKLWQLTTLCESAFLSESLKEQLPIPLETTQLLLVHSSPLSISFRMDERKFDVEGAYNIRYEIMKKRIDKALIKNSKERLTQPGKIAIIYSQPKEEAEYMDYITYLQVKGLLGSEVERLDLEDLQGVNGLKALRVDVGKPLFSELSEHETHKAKLKTDSQR
ncbi:GAF domain-containing protein [Echinicola marina]|uniref:GAF domain-containing protein n=1 Tax=Echinicola marina TaxID=2859768 RepID=UPI001CF6F3CB|nr:GAF domain-containing protein [Echinicola marina]UCS92480.1 GAF domain-containing protein [Echinicola marina]